MAEKKNLLIIDYQPDEYKKLLEPDFPEVTFYTATSGDEGKDVIRDIHIIFAIGHLFDDDLIKNASKLEWIQSLISGTDAIVALKTLKENVRINSGRGIHGPQMSEMAFLHMLNLTRNYPKMLRNQEKRVWERWPQPLLYGKTVGILGVGIIGEELAKKCKVFNMTVYGISRTKRDVEGIDRFYGREELSNVAAELDYLIILVPHSPETEKIVDATVISAMKPTAYLINLARGGVLDEVALMEALKTRKIAGAGLDVYRQEPLPRDDPLWGTENLIMTPKLGGMSDIYRTQVLPIISENLRKFLKGDLENMLNAVRR